MARRHSQMNRMTILKRASLLMVAAVVSLTWTESGRTQAPFCTIARGLDPLDVLTTSIKHNVWIGLDNSGSMRNDLNGDSPSPNPFPFKEDHPSTRLMIAKNVLTSIVTDPALNDANGDPLVNWGFFYTEDQPDDAGQDITSYACAVPQQLEADGSLRTGGGPAKPADCVGLDPDKTFPALCDPVQSRSIRDIIVQKLKPAAAGGIENNGGTANAPALDQIAAAIRTGYMGASAPAGQKNFIIYLSDGAEDCACEKRAVNLPPTSAGTGPIPASPKIRTNKTDPTVTTNVGSSSTRMGAYNAGIMARQALELIDPKLDGSQGDIFVLMFGKNGSTAEQGAIHWGWEASGYGWTSRPVCPMGANGPVGIGCARSGYIAPDGTTLAASIRDALTNIGVADASVSLGASTVGSVKELAYLADPFNVDIATPDDLLDTGGDQDALRLRGLYRNNILFTTAVDTPGFRGHVKAFNVFTVQTDGTRKADFTQVWDAGVKLQNRDPKTRKLYFNRPLPPASTPPSAIEFKPPSEGGTVTALELGVKKGDFWEYDPAAKGAASDSDAVEIVVRMIRGERVSSFSPLKFVSVDKNNKPTWKLFESANSTPAVVQQPPDSIAFDPPGPVDDYKLFFENNTNRLTMVYIGANGGMLHAFRADNGHELYGYIPSDALLRLKNLVRKIFADSNNVLDHDYFIATSPHVKDAFAQAGPGGFDGWRTVLTFGRGRGGKFLTALDITTVMNWDGKVPPVGATTSGFQAPKLVFNVGNRDGVSDLDPTTGDDYDGLGETWSEPRIGRVVSQSQEGQWVVFAGSGYGCAGTNEGKFFYVLKLEDGTIYKKFGPIQDAVNAGEPGLDENALVASPALYNPHIPGTSPSDNFVKFVYIGDLQGFVYKADVQAPDPLSWQFGVLFEVTSNADAAPGAGDHNQPITTEIAVLKLAGTDQILLFVGTGGDGRVQLANGETFKFVGIEDKDSGGFAGSLIQTSAGVPFFFDVPVGERVNVAPVTARNEPTNGVVFFASNARGFDPKTCGNQFLSSLFAFGATTGQGTYDMDPNTGGVQDSVTGITGKITGLFHRDEHLYVAKSGGIGVPAGTDVRGSDEFKPPTATGGATVQILVDSFRVSPF